MTGRIVYLDGEKSPLKALGDEDIHIPVTVLGSADEAYIAKWSWKGRTLVSNLSFTLTEIKTLRV